MRQLLRLIALLLAARALQRVLLGTAARPDLPPIIDEVEALERRLRSVLPSGWTLERRTRRLWGTLGPVSSQPHLDDWSRAWVLSTPWPNHEPQRAQVLLYLLRDGTTLGHGREIVARWERFAVAGQDPSVLQIGNDTFTWATLPGWPTARVDIASALA